MAGQLPGVHECARRRRCHPRVSFDNLQLWGADRRSRRSSFYLYQDLSTRPASEYFQNPQAHSTTRSTEQTRAEKHQPGESGDLKGVAREARERLDEKLRAASLSNNKRRNSFWCRITQQVVTLINIYDPKHHGSNCLEEVWPSRISDWLASDTSVTEVARRYAEPHVTQNAHSSSTGLSKASIDLLERQTFTPKHKNICGKYSWKKLINTSTQEECPVCLESFQTSQVLIHLPCTHRFHSGCLVPWLNRHCHCPCCRTRISIKPP